MIARKSYVTVAAQKPQQLPKAAPVKKPAPQQKVNQFMPALAAGLAAITLASPALAGEVNVSCVGKGKWAVSFHALVRERVAPPARVLACCRGVGVERQGHCTVRAGMPARGSDGERSTDADDDDVSHSPPRLSQSLNALVRSHTYVHVHTQEEDLRKTVCAGESVCGMRIPR